MATSNIILESQSNFFENGANAPSPLNVLMESRSVLELGQFFQSLAHIQMLPKGDGHPVLVIPGFLTNDRYTALLRWFLRKQGYEVHPWTQGTNRAFKLRNIQQLQKKISLIRNQTGKKVSLIGWSLGGMYARYLSHNMPEFIRQTITLGTPFSRNMNPTVVRRFYEILNKQKFENIHPDILRKITDPIPVTSTSIFSKLDGVIAWECSICDSPKSNHEHIEIESSHIGLPHNPASLFVIADRLALPENSWEPFNQNSLSEYLKQIKNPKAIVNSLSQSDINGIKAKIQSLQELYDEFKQSDVITNS